MKKTLENKTKRSLWDGIKTALKVSIPTSLLMMPVISNVGGYISTNGIINDTETSIGKGIIAEDSKKFYQDAGAIGKICWFGDYLAAQNYLKNQSGENEI